MMYLLFELWYVSPDPLAIAQIQYSMFNLQEPLAQAKWSVFDENPQVCEKRAKHRCK